MTTEIWVNIGSGNGLLPDGTKPLPEPMLTYHQGGQVTITLRTILLEIHQPSITKITLKITYLKFHKNNPGANEFIDYVNPPETYNQNKMKAWQRCTHLLGRVAHHVKFLKLLDGPWFSIKMSSYQYRKSHCGDKSVLRRSYLHNVISHTGKMASLYWTNPLITMYTWFTEDSLSM